MLEKPDLNESTLISQLQRTYELPLLHLEFLSLGADPNAAVYRADTPEGTSYFVKVKRGDFYEASVNLLNFFHDRGLKHIIPPLLAKTGTPWTNFEHFTVVLYPFVAGQNGYAAPLAEEAWLELGRTLRRLHTLEPPPYIKEHIQYETFDAHWRDMVKEVLASLERTTFEDTTSAEMASFLLRKRNEILELVARAERFAQDLRERVLEPVLCHADLHAGNLLIDSAQHFYIVDWDNLVLAPKEHDLMFFGGGLGFKGYTPHEEERLFFRGYGQTELDPVALVYYRFERIVQDIAVYGDELMRQTGSDEDRKASLGYLTSNFESGGTIERAYAVEESV